MLQVRILFKHFVRSEIADLSRWASALLFAATVLLIFGFAFGSMDPSIKTKVVVAQVILTIFLALQTSFSQVFAPEAEDRAFDVLRTSPVSPEAWFLSKYLVVVFFGLLTLIPTLILSAFFYHQIADALLSIDMLILSFLVVLGLSAIGTLLAALVHRAEARALLYPLIYFPLTVPVLLAASQTATSIVVKGQGLGEGLSSWLGMLLIFDIIYFVLGLLLFNELIQAD